MTIEQAISEKIQTAQTYTFKGKTKTVAEWSEEIGLSISCIYRRLETGWTFEKIIKTQSKRKLYTYNGETHLLADWAKILNIPAGRLYYRLQSGQSVETAFSIKTYSKTYTVKGITFNSIREACEHFNIPYKTVKGRLQIMHWPLEKALLTPMRHKRK